MSAPACSSPSACWPPLQARQKTGEGQWVETSLLEATDVARRLRGRQLLRQRHAAGEARPGASRLARPIKCSRPPTAGSPSAARSRISSASSVDMIGKPELADDPRFKTNAERVKNNDLIVASCRRKWPRSQHRRLDGRARSRRHSRPARCCITTRSSPIRRSWRAAWWPRSSTPRPAAEDARRAARRCRRRRAACAARRRRSASTTRRSRKPREGSETMVGAEESLRRSR